GVFAAASIAAYLVLEFKYPIDTTQGSPTQGHRLFPGPEQTTATTLLGLQLAAGAAFWATALWGILDAQLLFKREVVTDTRERSTKPEKHKGKLSIIPMPLGVGIVGKF